ncbi:hatching enzyme 1.2-like [Antennarius striatus]|uniref:hatching enzyme 1.2-like n=1 Tax=Antennarius striatus TaxID=241820 RepID=UPI0035B1F1E8
MILQTAVLSVLLCSANSFSIRVNPAKSEDSSGNGIDDDNSVSMLIERANANLGKNSDGPLVMFGDIAVPTGLQNADPCTARSCLWPKSQDGNVYIPYRISNQFSSTQRNDIVQGLRSFSNSTCIRFTPLNGQEDFVDIQSQDGCFSFVGRRGRGQVVSLARQGCVFLGIIQHEMLHALGFNHEQTRSDRDENVRILFQNILPGRESNFFKIRTRNLGTPYDYMSVMHYSRFAFSRNRRPTIVPIPDPNALMGRATSMSPTDIRRVNLLYRCRNTEETKPTGRQVNPEASHSRMRS